MRRVLFLTYWIPPRPAIGTVRCAHLVEHLHEYGWSPTVVTAHLNGERNGEASRGYVETNYFDFKGYAKQLLARRRSASAAAQQPFSGEASNRVPSLLRQITDLATYRDEYAGWLPFAARAASTLVKQEKWDAVLSSAPPMTASVAAAIAHRRVPWIADMRDLWAEDDSAERSAIQKLFDDRFERAVLSRAAALVASSPHSAARFQRRFPNTPCFALFTGFEPREWDHIPFARNQRCTLLYAGTLYRGKRDPSVLFAALVEIFEQRLAHRDELSVTFYVPVERWLEEMIASFGLQDVVHLKGVMPRETVLHQERAADRLLLLLWNGPTAHGIVPGKIFEYFGARRPVLALGGPPNCDVERLLRRSGAGVRCTTIEQTKSQILKALQERRFGIQRVTPLEDVDEYSAQRFASQFAKVLDTASAR